MTTQDIVQKLWNLCDVLRDDGINYSDYVTELVLLLFIKMEYESTESGVLQAHKLPPFARWPELAVTGVDLCAAMLEKLRAKHAGRRLELRCADYLAMDLGAEQYGAVVSVESLHHFTPEQKLELYKKIHAALRPGGFFLEADYIACCEEEETLLRAESARRRARANIPADVFIHFDTPLTLEHELALLRAAGFSCCEAVDSIAGATFLRGRK